MDQNIYQNFNLLTSPRSIGIIYMKNLFLVLFTLLSTSAFTQIPETGDSIYWSGKYCNTAETIEDALDQWVWNGNLNDCIQPSQGMLDALWPALWLTDNYECCCQVASLPGSNAAMTGFWNSPCQEYLDGIGFYYMTVDENDIDLDGIYIDIYGIQHTIPPKGLSIMNKTKYIRL
tara:strand:+ start:103 stop:627 length:525 start_codon:yes stop_codon:yes gene_type:complete